MSTPTPSSGPRSSKPKKVKDPAANAKSATKNFFDENVIKSVAPIATSGKSHCHTGIKGYLLLAMDADNMHFFPNDKIRNQVSALQKVLAKKLPNIFYAKHYGKDEEFNSFQKILNAVTDKSERLNAIASQGSEFGEPVSKSEEILIRKITAFKKHLCSRFELEKPGFGTQMLNFLKTDFYFRELVGAGVADASVAEWSNLSKVDICNWSALRAQNWDSVLEVKQKELARLLKRKQVRKGLDFFVILI